MTADQSAVLPSPRGSLRGEGPGEGRRVRDARPQGREPGAAGQQQYRCPDAEGARRRWQRLFRCLRRAQPGPRLRGTRPNPVVPPNDEAPPRKPEKGFGPNGRPDERRTSAEAKHEDQAPPMSVAITAFCTCSRFSASSHTRLRGPSSTPSLTSSPRCAGRQCRKMERPEAVSIISSVMQ